MGLGAPLVLLQDGNSQAPARPHRMQSADSAPRTAPKLLCGAFCVGRAHIWCREDAWRVPMGAGLTACRTGGLGGGLNPSAHRWPRLMGWPRSAGLSAAEPGLHLPLAPGSCLKRFEQHRVVFAPANLIAVK